MLFYNENDEICLKIKEEIKILSERDYFELEGNWYTYSNGYFYEGIDYGDGDYETNWEKRTHPRHMNIIEEEEAFAPPSYKNELMDDLFKYKEDINSDQHLVMYILASRTRDEIMKNHESSYYSISHKEFEEVGGEDFLKELSELVLEGYYYNYYIYDDKPHDKAYISITWSYE